MHLQHTYAGWGCPSWLYLSPNSKKQWTCIFLFFTKMANLEPDIGIGKNLWSTWYQEIIGLSNAQMIQNVWCCLESPELLMLSGLPCSLSATDLTFLSTLLYHQKFLYLDKLQDKLQLKCAMYAQHFWLFIMSSSSLELLRILISIPDTKF